MKEWIKKHIYYFNETTPDYKQTVKILQDLKTKKNIQVSGELQLAYMLKKQDLKKDSSPLDTILELIDNFEPGVIENIGYKPYIKDFEAIHTRIDAKKAIEYTLNIKTHCWGGNSNSKGAVNDWIILNYNITRE
ncbi:MAG: hypothetical protein ACP5NV_01975 [Candidatus Woesearchaeota archaeon]